MNPTPPTIGVFDSGFGGLTVLRALLRLIPSARFVYLGDTARLPYGSKSQQTIARYAVSSARFLHRQGADLLVIACNTASALALDEIRAALPIPVTGVIAPGAQAARAASQAVSQESSLDQQDAPGDAGGPASVSPGHVLVLATAATVQSRAYTRELTALGLAATEKACPLLVPLVEEGWTDHPVTAEVLRIYLSEALADAPNARTLVLGCTHYPLLKPLIERTLATLHHPLNIIDAAQATAEATATLLRETRLTTPATTLSSFTAPGSPANVPGSPGWRGGGSASPTHTFYATDSIEKFRTLGTRFLGQPLPEVHLLDLGG